MTPCLRLVSVALLVLLAAGGGLSADTFNECRFDLAEATYPTLGGAAHKAIFDEQYTGRDLAVQIPESVLQRSFDYLRALYLDRLQYSGELAEFRYGLLLRDLQVGLAADRHVRIRAVIGGYLLHPRGYTLSVAGDVALLVELQLRLTPSGELDSIAFKPDSADIEQLSISSFDLYPEELEEKLNGEVFPLLADKIATYLTFPIFDQVQLINDITVKRCPDVGVNRVNFTTIVEPQGGSEPLLMLGADLFPQTTDWKVWNPEIFDDLWGEPREFIPVFGAHDFAFEHFERDLIAPGRQLALSLSAPALLHLIRYAWSFDDRYRGTDWVSTCPLSGQVPRSISVASINWLEFGAPALRHWWCGNTFTADTTVERPHVAVNGEADVFSVCAWFRGVVWPYINTDSYGQRRLRLAGEVTDFGACNWFLDLLLDLVQALDFFNLIPDSIPFDADILRADFATKGVSIQLDSTSADDQTLLKHLALQLNGTIGSWPDVDGDDDGLADGAEGRLHPPCSPYRQDSDSDGWIDGDEVLLHYTSPSSPDTDGDGVRDPQDNCPMSPNARQEDGDGDGQGDLCDPDFIDLDGDGVPDTRDNCAIDSNPVEDCDSDPSTPPVQCDTDGDGLGNLCDCDDDNDGAGDPFVVDPASPFWNAWRLIPRRFPGGLCGPGEQPWDCCEPGTDTCPTTEEVPADLHEYCYSGVTPFSDYCNNDFWEDCCPTLDAAACAEVYRQTQTCPWPGTVSMCDYKDGDDDNDGIPDLLDNCPFTKNSGQENNDGDRRFDATACWGPGDQFLGASAACRAALELVGGDVCDRDDDNDGVLDCRPDPADVGAPCINDDNCALVANADQADADGDGVGDACDVDSDGDAVWDVCYRDVRVAAIPSQPLPPPEEEATSGCSIVGPEDEVFRYRSDNCRGVFNPYQEDQDSDGLGDPCDPDDDNDGIPDMEDACLTAMVAVHVDHDADGVEDLCDPDLDGDGIPNGDDNCADLPNPEQENADGDTLGDPCDPDDDNDAVPDDQDLCPGQYNPDQLLPDVDPADYDCETLDYDGDGVLDGTDNCPGIVNPDQHDADGDNAGDACDFDTDNDGRRDDGDNCPEAWNPDQADHDLDGLGDACDSDADNDGYADATDDCPTAYNESQADQDRDGQGDACDPDLDGDGLVNGVDNCMRVRNPEQTDVDRNGVGDECDPDLDGDGLINAEDNCPIVPNPDQRNLDGDESGDVCDADANDNGIDDRVDPCPDRLHARATDSDGDGVVDACDDDPDGDGVADAEDNCPDAPNPDLGDLDGDGEGDACDDDFDGDGLPNDDDSCPRVANPERRDADGDGVGDECDPDLDGDGSANDRDNCPAVANADQTDADGDGLGDACDPDLDGDGFPNDTDNCPTVPNPDQHAFDRAGTPGSACDQRALSAQGGCAAAGRPAGGAWLAALLAFGLLGLRAARRSRPARNTP